jgi:hypothetical protein
MWADERTRGKCAFNGLDPSVKRIVRRPTPDDVGMGRADDQSFTAAGFVLHPRTKARTQKNLPLDAALRMLPEDYLQQRVDDQIAWYDRKSGLNKKLYIRMEIAAILLSVSIPLVTDFITAETPYIKSVVSFMGVAIAAITGIVSLMKYRDNWIEYRTTSEMLRHERFMYLTSVGAYQTRDRFAVFVVAVEEILTKEINNWGTNRAANGQKEKEEKEEKANEEEEPNNRQQNTSSTAAPATSEYVEYEENDHEEIEAAAEEQDPTIEEAHDPPAEEEAQEADPEPLANEEAQSQQADGQNDPSAEEAVESEPEDPSMEAPAEPESTEDEEEPDEEPPTSW